VFNGGNMKNEKKSFWSILGGISIFLISILFIVSISVDVNSVRHDYDTIQEAKLSFIQILKLEFPDLNNPIGPFGVFFGFWLIVIFGKFFSLSLLIGTLLMGFFALFFKSEKHPIQKTTFFIIFAFFINLLLLFVRPDAVLHKGFLPQIVFDFFTGIFNTTGTVIISFVIILSCLVLIFELETVKIFLIKSYQKFSNLTKTIIKFIKNLRKKPAKKRKKSLKITDHTSQSEKKKNEIPPKPVIKKNFTQDKSEISNNPRPEYKIPNIEHYLISKKATKEDRVKIEENIKNTSKILIDKLAEFGVEAEVKNVNIGPIITQYEIEPSPGVKVNKFHTLADDLALAIKAKSIRVQAPIPGRGLVGIEIPNVKRDTIYLKEILQSEEMQKMGSKLAIGLGKDISGKPMVADLGKMPHLLIAGATGSGKSVCVNTIINSILFRTTPQETRFILIDPKRIELSGYEGIPHLIQEVVTDPENALTALEWAVNEMEKRYELLQEYKVKNLKTYNKKIKKIIEKNKGKAEEEQIEDKPLPFIIIIVDELADLMMTIGKDVERPITRLAQMARAIGIHLILATQRPSIKVITGIIKANFPSRIAFKVSTKIDSRVIIDSNGAESLLGLGDSLFIAPGTGNAVRIHGAFIDPEEVHEVVKYLKMQPKPEDEITIIKEELPMISNLDYDDELFPEAALATVIAGSAAVSMLQRHFKIGYARAGRLIDMLEQAGIVGPHVGSKSREVLATEEDLKKYGLYQN